MKSARWQKDETFWALKDVNLEIKKGERVGIIGPNGSGKTTLLKIISGITTPTIGSVKTEEKIVSLIDLEAGFQRDLTGIQNIYLNGLLLGMTKKEIGRQISKIIAFADIDQFIDTPIFTYSEGMKLRLGFSVAVHAKPNILILDEALSVGDVEFQIKSRKKIKEFFDLGKTVVVVSQWLDFIKQNCDRILTFEKGEIINDTSKTS